MKSEVVEPLLTAADVASILRVKPSTIYRWASRRDLPAIRIRRGRRRALLRFRKADIIRFVE